MRVSRPPAAAGTFYPGDPRRLGSEVDRLLAAAPTGSGRRPWGLVVPHAGYRFSGSVAATAYAALRPWTAEVSRVAVLGPAHFVPLRGCATSSASGWETPLGDVPVDDELRAAAGCPVADAAHEPEHAIEVQLPFLLRLIGPGLRFLPVAVGDAPAADVADVIQAVSDLVDLVIVSTDLSHYHDDTTARALDRRTADAILGRDPDAVGPTAACGVFALRGLLEHARRTERRIDLLELRTSADASGDRDRVVGYGAFAVDVG